MSQSINKVSYFYREFEVMLELLKTINFRNKNSFLFGFMSYLNYDLCFFTHCFFPDFSIFSKTISLTCFSVEKQKLSCKTSFYFKTVKMETTTVK